MGIHAGVCVQRESKEGLEKDMTAMPHQKLTRKKTVKNRIELENRIKLKK